MEWCESKQDSLTDSSLRLLTPVLSLEEKALREQVHDLRVSFRFIDTAGWADLASILVAALSTLK